MVRGFAYSLCANLTNSCIQSLLDYGNTSQTGKMSSGISTEIAQDPLKDESFQRHYEALDTASPQTSCLLSRRNMVHALQPVRELLALIPFEVQALLRTLDHPQESHSTALYALALL